MSEMFDVKLISLKEVYSLNHLQEKIMCQIFCFCQSNRRNMIIFVDILVWGFVNFIEEHSFQCSGSFMFFSFFVTASVDYITIYSMVYQVMMTSIHLTNKDFWIYTPSYAQSRYPISISVGQAFDLCCLLNTPFNENSYILIEL